MSKKMVRAGYIFCDKGFTKDEKIFSRVAKKRRIDLRTFNLLEKFSEKQLLEFAKSCDIIYNNSAEDSAVEIVKTFEELGKKVIESSEAYFHSEDKWLFFVKCQEAMVPTPETILLSQNMNLAKSELIEFKKWPVVIKRVYGTQGNFVEKADDLASAAKIIEKFWKKEGDRAQIIAQEFIESPCYRVTTIGGKIVQAVVKKSAGWKATGVYAKKVSRFIPDANLKKMVGKISAFSKIDVCGIDLLKKGDTWTVLEVNAQPAFDFIESEREQLIDQVFDLLIKKSK